MRMTSLERVRAAVDHTQPDRIPMDLRYTPEMKKKLLEYLGMSEADFWEWAGQDVFTVRPRYTKPASEIYYADPTAFIDEEGNLCDIYGVPFRQVDTGKEIYIENVNKPPLADMETLEELEDYPWPSADDWDYSGIPAGIDAHPDKAVWCRSRGPFQIAQMMRGVDTFLMDMAAEPEFAEAILHHIMSFVREDARRSLEAGQGRYTFIEYNDDVATQRGMLISPNMWRQFIKPIMADFCEMAHSYGAKVRYHSCGSIYAIIPDLIEVGVDILNPIQPLAADMDPYKIKKEFGDKICLHGGIDIQELLPNGTVEEVRETVKRMIQEVGKGGGYILAGSHTIQADANPENIKVMIETALTEIGGN